MKILIVDDEVDFLETMSPIMEEWDYDLIKAVNGKEAIDILKDKKPDIIVLDYMMPQMDGLAVLKKIRKINKDIPVIMFTAHPDIKVIKGTEKLGVSAFIPKLSIYSDNLSALKITLSMLGKKIG
ncbi:MAG: response regulator [Candidatus Omnitrophota bacterium]